MFSAHVTRQTQGAFDIATGALIKAWGFYRRQGRVPTPAERAAAMGRTGTRFLALDRGRRTVRYLRQGLEINLGGIGKGYALDRAAELIARDWGVSSALLHGGSSSVRAIGIPPGQPRGWPVTIKHPWDPDRRLGTVYLDRHAPSARRRPRSSILSTMGGNSGTCSTRGPGGPPRASTRRPSSPRPPPRRTPSRPPSSSSGSSRPPGSAGPAPTSESSSCPPTRDRPLTFNLGPQTFSPSPPG